MRLALITDDWDGTSPGIERVEDPTWPQVEAALLALDQEAHTEVGLADAEMADVNIAVGGGNGDYVVGISNPDEDSFPALVDRTKAGGDEVEVVSGGQVGVYPSHMVVGRDLMLRAMKTYFETGEPDPLLEWEE